MNNVILFKKSFLPKFDKQKSRKHIIYHNLMSALDIENLLVLHDHQLV